MISNENFKNYYKLLALDNYNNSKNINIRIKFLTNLDGN